MSAIAGVLVVQRMGGYKDIPGLQYHFPKKRYLARIESLLNCLVLIYEPRRGGTSRSSGGRMGFVASAFVDAITDDKDDPTHAFLHYRMYVDFVNRVPGSKSSLSPKALEHAVHTIPFAEAEEIFTEGMRMDGPVEGVRQGLVDVQDLVDLPKRATREGLLPIAQCATLGFDFA